MEIRPTQAQDHQPFLAAMAVSGLSTPPAAIRFYLEHRGIATYIAVDGDHVIGTGMATRYRQTGWIAMLTVRPEHRGCGIGRALLEWGEDTLRRQGVQTLILTASAAGRPLYEKVGYTPGVEYQGWRGPGLNGPFQRPSVRPVRPGDWATVMALDRAATGEDRSRFLTALTSGWVITGTDGALTGYYLPLPWGGGPAIATNAADGRLLLDLIRSQTGTGGQAVLRLPAANEAGLQYAEEAGFVLTNRPTFMVKGPWPTPYQPSRIWSLFGYELG